MGKLHAHVLPRSAYKETRPDFPAAGLQAGLPSEVGPSG